MKSSFRSFVSADPEVTLEMAMGRGEGELMLPTNQAMANLLSIIKGPWMRARALDWLMFDGMMQAIKGRSELCKKVNMAIAGELKGPIITGQQFKPNVTAGPFARPAGATPFARKIKAESRWVYAAQGEDPEDYINDEKDPVKQNDLFSPEAWQRRPILGKILLDGLDIHAYYEKFYEPRVMVIDYEPGMKSRVNLRQAREFLEAHGMEGFRYGGFNGYIQYVEKGHSDWLHPAMQRGWSNNDQYGPDLRLDDREGKEQYLSLDKRKRPVLHLVGGAITKDDRRSAATIQKMTAQFSHIGQAIEQGKDLSDMNPHTVDKIRGIIGLNNLIKKSELTLGEDKTYKASPSRVLFDLDASRNESYFYIPKDTVLDMDAYLNVVRIGLDQEFTRRKADQFLNKNAFGPEWDGTEENKPADGYWYIAEAKTQGRKGYLNFKLPKAIQEKVYNYITNLYPEGILRVRFRIDNKQVFPECKPATRDALFVVSAIFNQGVNAKPEIARKFRRVLYTAPDFKQKKFITRDDMVSKKIENIDNPAFDPVLQPLWDKGYRWEARDASERHGPNWKKYYDGVLKLGTDRYVVKWEPPTSGDPEDKGEFYLMVPSGKDGEKLDPASYGKLGQAMLGGGILHSGGDVKYDPEDLARHVGTTPAGPKTWERLQHYLLGGHFGEKVKSHHLTELRCVKDGVKYAMNNFQRKTHTSKVKAFFEEHELLGWAVEALYAFSGDRAFQVGYITPGEVERILKWNADKELDKYEKGRWVRDGRGEIVGENPDWQEGDGQGIQALLAKYDLNREVDDEEMEDLDDEWKEKGFKPTYRDLIISLVDDLHKTNPIIDYRSFGDSRVSRALGENAFEARVRAITGYVFGKMMIRQHELEAKEGKEKGASALQSGEEENELRGKGHIYDDEYEDADKWGPISPEEIRKGQGIAEPEIEDRPPERPLATFNAQSQKPSVRVVGASPVAPARGQAALDDDDDDWGDSPAVAPARKTPAPKPAPKPAASTFSRPAAPPPKPVAGGSMLDDDDSDWNENRFAGYEQWLKSYKETEVAFDPRVKPRDGCGFNYWGAPGKVGGTSITGEPDTAKSDPTGKKGKKYARKR